MSVTKTKTKSNYAQIVFYAFDFVVINIFLFCLVSLKLHPLFYSVVILVFLLTSFGLQKIIFANIKRKPYSHKDLFFAFNQIAYFIHYLYRYLFKALIITLISGIILFIASLSISTIVYLGVTKQSLSSLFSDFSIQTLSNLSSWQSNYLLLVEILILVISFIMINLFIYLKAKRDFAPYILFDSGGLTHPSMTNCSHFFSKLFAKTIPKELKKGILINQVSMSLNLSISFLSFNFLSSTLDFKVSLVITFSIFIIFYQFILCLDNIKKMTIYKSNHAKIKILIHKAIRRGFDIGLNESNSKRLNYLLTDQDAKIKTKIKNKD
jgi:hypothetical protein